MPMLRLAIVPVIVVVALYFGWKSGYFELDRRQELAGAVERVRTLPFVGLTFIVIYAIVVSIGLPATITNLLAGAVFGAWVGAFYAWAGAMVATVLAHWLARTVMKAPLRRLFGEHRLLKKLKDNQSFVPLFRLRILPVAPFAVLDYVAGLAGVSLKALLLATAAGVLPSVLAYSYVGAELVKGIVGQDDASNRAFWIAGGITLGMFLISVVPNLIKRLRD